MPAGSPGDIKNGGWDDMNRRMTIRQPFDLALSLEMGQAFRWRRVGDEGVRQRDWTDPPAPWRRNGGGGYSGVLGEYLVHLRQTDDGLEYRVGGRDGERDDVDLDPLLEDHFRFLTEDPELEEFQKPSEAVPIELKRFAIQIYEHYTGRKLLDQRTTA